MSDFFVADVADQDAYLEATDLLLLLCQHATDKNRIAQCKQNLIFDLVIDRFVYCEYHFATGLKMLNALIKTENDFIERLLLMHESV